MEKKRLLKEVFTDIARKRIVRRDPKRWYQAGCTLPQALVETQLKQCCRAAHRSTLVERELAAAIMRHADFKTLAWEICNA